MTRLLIFSVWRLAIFQRLTGSTDTVLAAVAAKGVKEMTYHRDYCARSVVTLAQGTDQSRARMVTGLHTHWPFVEELFQADDVSGTVGVEPASVRGAFDEVIDQVLTAADLPRPAVTAVAGGGGRAGIHTEAMTARHGRGRFGHHAAPLDRDFGPGQQRCRGDPLVWQSSIEHRGDELDEGKVRLECT